MGCGGSSAAAQEPQPQVGSPAPTLLTGQTAIIRNCPVAHLNGKRVVCEKYNADLNEWLVKGDKFPLTVGMSLGEQCLEGEQPGNGEAFEWNGPWTVTWSNGMTRSINVSNGCFDVFGGSYVLQLDKDPVQFQWPDGTIQHVSAFSPPNVTWATTAGDTIRWTRQ
jgi:hypothetical protein